MDPRLYTYERRTPRLNNPTFKSEQVTDSLLIFKGGPLDSSSLYKNKITDSPFKNSFDDRRLPYHPPEISKIRSTFQNNRSKVPLSNLSSYARQIMFPTQKADTIQTQAYSVKPQKAEKFLKPSLYLDNKERNYIKQICKINNQFLSKSQANRSVDINNQEAAGITTFNDKDRRYYRYKHSYQDHDQLEHKPIQNSRFREFDKPFVPSRLNYVDELKGIL